jgi:hypothetical protein
MSCYLIKLINGETLLASVINTDDTHLYVNNPIQVEFTAASVYSSYWLPLPEMANIIPLKTEHIVTYSRTSDSMSAFYNKTINSLHGADDEEQEPPPEFDKQEKLEEYKNKIRLIRTLAANTIH